MNPKCPECDRYLIMGANFCRMCGNDLRGLERPAYFSGAEQQYASPAPKDENHLFKQVGTVTMLIILAVMLFEVIWLILKFGDIYTILDYNAPKPITLNLFLMLPMSVNIYTLRGLQLQIFWILVFAIIIVSVALVLLELLAAYRKRKTEPDAVSKTSLYWIAVLLTASFAVEIGISMIGAAMGMPVDSSWLNKYTPLELQFLLTEAPVWEEFVSRMLIIGAPMAVLALAQTRKAGSLKMLFGRFEMSKVALVLLIISSLAFGLAHYENWGFVKILMTFIGGLVEGYVFIRFGLHASILMHFINNNLSAFVWAGAAALGGLVTLAILAVGGVLAILLLLMALKKKDWKSGFLSLPLIVNK